MYTYIRLLHFYFIFVFKNMKKISTKYSKLKYDQFLFVLNVLLELNILKINENLLEFTTVKNPLTNSNIYKFISLIESIRGKQ